VSSATGTLAWQPLPDHLDLVALPVAAAAAAVPEARVAGIDPTLADTAAFCTAYDIALELSANCVIVTGRRGEVTRYAAVLVLATMRADINRVVRRELDVRKCSFAPQADAVTLTGMEFGGITPVGLPAEWPILVDEAVLAAGDVVIGSGLRRSKLLVPAHRLLELPGAVSLPLAG
jgi:prolyl-tRNA editing enzyme YbaK/EbsC (Cys-tRNA(Pro) deacylase)